jgi:heterodisulfide reductase subunit A
MVVLSVGMESRHDARELANLFGMGCDFSGFFIERHPKLDPILTMVEGVFIAGACQGPMAIPETVAQAAAAAMRAASLIAQGTVLMEPVRAYVNASNAPAAAFATTYAPTLPLYFMRIARFSEVITPCARAAACRVAPAPAQPSAERIYPPAADGADRACCGMCASRLKRSRPG